MNPNLKAEIQHRLSIGCELVTMKELRRRFAELGYRLHRSMDCRSTARYLDSGRTYPCCTTYLREIDTGLSLYNVDARRDANYRAAQKLRRQIFSISRGAIFED